MMNPAEIIRPAIRRASVAIVKVNPAVATVGSLNPQSALGLIRKTVYDEGRRVARVKSSPLLRLIFGNTSRPAPLSRVLMVGRMLMGIFLALNGFLIGSQLGMAYCSAAVFSVVAGFLLIPGVATRLTLTAAAVWYGVMAVESIAVGGNPVVSLIVAGVSVLLLLIGPGRYSADALFKKRIFRSVRRYETRRIMERRFSYRAMHYAHLH